MNLYAYCKDNPIYYTDNLGCIPFASVVNKLYYKVKVWGFDNKWWGRVNYSQVITVENTNEKGFFYAYSSIDVDSAKKTFGAGINIFNAIGVYGEVTQDYDISLGVALTPYAQFSASIGLSGITLTAGFNIGNTTHEFSVGIGLGLAAVVVGAVSLIYSGGQTWDTVSQWFRTIFGF